MKKTVTLLALLLAISLAGAKPVTPETAQRAAENLLGRAVVDVTPKDLTECYLFHGADGQGFVLLAADDAAAPILGYSQTSAAPTENIPPHILSWLDGYRRQIAYIREHGVAASPEVTAEWQELLSGRTPEPKATAVDTLLTSLWDQSPRYNNMCPYDESAHEHALVGCVSTAVSQVMRYWGHPAQGRGYHAYKSKRYDTISVDYSQAIYDWDNMPDWLNYTSPQQEIDAVAKLCFEVGVMMDMNYSPTGSGAYEHSGGMLQRAMIAAAMVIHPKLLICDEPTTALDVSVQAKILKLLKELSDEYKVGILLISHDLMVVKQLCENVAVMYKGNIVEQGKTLDIFNAPKDEYTQQLMAAIPKRRRHE